MSSVFIARSALESDRAGAATCGPTTNFITTWKTDNPGSTNSTSIKLPSQGGGYNYQVDWNNDGVMDETVNTTNKVHDFGVAGTYTIQICGSYPRITFGLSGGEDRDKILRVDQWGDNPWTSMNYAFFDASNLQVTATDAPNLSSVTDMYGMFIQASALTGNSSFNTWDTSSVTNMSCMFQDAEAFNAPIGNWDTGNVTNMNSMFTRAVAFNQDISQWDTGSVTDMYFMFMGAKEFNQPLNSWDTGNVTTMASMFFNAEDFNQPLNNWDTGNVTTMNTMFANAKSFNGPIGSWNVSNVATMASMFSGALAFNQPLNNWDTGNVLSMVNMFSGAGSFNQDLNNWDTGNVLEMTNMFFKATSFNGNISTWDTQNTYAFNAMFFGATSFNKPIGGWNTSSATNMKEMFANASSFNQPIGTWDVSNVTTMESMFSGASLEIVDINVPSVNLLSKPMAFNQDLSAWDTGNVTNMAAMFTSDGEAAYGFYAGLGVTILDIEEPLIHPFSYSLASWDMTNVTNATGMLSHSSLSPAEYDATLDAWAGQNLQGSLELGADGLNYCENEVGRQSIITNHSWTIGDGGENCLYLAPASQLTGVDVAANDELQNPDMTERTIRLFKNNLPLAESNIQFEAAVDWSNVTGEVDTVNYKSVVSGLAGADSVVGTHALYVPKAASHNAVIICQGALTLAAVTSSCANAQILTASDPSVSIVTINSATYWKVTGLTGTGGMSILWEGVPNTGFQPQSIVQTVMFGAFGVLVTVLGSVILGRQLKRSA